MEKITKIMLILILVVLPVSYAGGDFAYNRLCNFATPLDVSIVEPLDGETIPVINKEHLEMHEGHHYFIKTWLENTGAALSSNNFAFTTPNTTTRIHAKTILHADTDTVFNIYENCAITGGTPVTGINNDRDSPNLAELIPVAAPTINIPGTLIFSGRNGGGRDPVGVALSGNYEIIARTNTTYCFVITKQTSADTVIDVDFFWYEEASPHN